MLPIPIGKMGNITYKIKKQDLSYDEIKFFIPVTNNSIVEQCFIVILRDAGGREIDRAPVTIQPIRTWANRILPGATETMVIDSNPGVLAVKLWDIQDVADQTIKFELVADPTGWLGHCSIVDSSYNIVDTKTKVMPAHKDDPSTAEAIEKFMKLLIILIVVILIARVAAEFR